MRGIVVRVAGIAVALLVALSASACLMVAGRVLDAVRPVATSGLSLQGELPGTAAALSFWTGPAAERALAATRTVPYASELAALGSGGAVSAVSAEVPFDDAWLLADPRRYNDGLAEACAALSAVCNSQSLRYAGGDGAFDFAAAALGELGFSGIDTRSYAARSSVADELASLAAGSTDVAAYVIARKELSGADGRPAGHAVFVGVRGTYGSEWLSNFNCGAGLDDGGHHDGFEAAAGEVRSEVERYLARWGLGSSDTKVLICGHSRGGAVANLLAADLVDGARAGRIDVDANGVFAYTFASPNATFDGRRGDSRYDCIFNIVNPADLVPRLPFAAWGCGRYGRTVHLPAAGSPSFSAAFSAMKAARAQVVGYDVEGEDAARQKRAFDQLEKAIGKYAPSMGDMLRPPVVAAALQALFSVDPASVLSAHCPDTYLAWMKATGPERLLVE